MHVGFRSALALVPLFLFLGISASSVHAQFSGMDQEASLVTSPQYPRPDSEVMVELSAYSMNTAGADIKWFEDGKELTSVRNERSITLSAGSVGATKTIKATITLPGTAPFSLTKTITPGDVDIIIESDTYVPPFYKGRALPSAESRGRAIAIVHLGGNTNPAALSYEWKLGETVLHGGPVRGKQSTEIEFPLFDDIPLSVTIYDTKGNPIVKRSIALKNTQPEIAFYEESPLRGQSEKALGREFTLVGEETTLRAEPYYLDRESAQSMGSPKWQLGGNTVDTGNIDPYTITLRKTGGAGSTPIDFIITNTQKLFQNARGSFTIYFEQ